MPNNQGGTINQIQSRNIEYLDDFFNDDSVVQKNNTEPEDATGIEYLDDFFAEPVAKPTKQAPSKKPQRSKPRRPQLHQAGSFADIQLGGEEQPDQEESAEEAVQRLIHEYGPKEGEEIVEPDVDVSVGVDKQTAGTSSKPSSGLENGFRDSEKESKFQPGDEIVIYKGSGSFRREENSRPINITDNMVGERFTITDIDENGLAFLEGEDDQIFVPVNSLSSFKLLADYRRDRERNVVTAQETNQKMIALEPPITPITYKIPGDEEMPQLEAVREQIHDTEPADVPVKEVLVDPSHLEIINGTIEGIKAASEEKVKEVATEWYTIPSYTFRPENNEIIQLGIGDVWKFKVRSGPKTDKGEGGYRNFIVENIARSEDSKQLRIKFVSSDPVERSVDEWLSIFQVGSREHTNVENVTQAERANAADLAAYENRDNLEEGTPDFHKSGPGEMAGEVYEDGEVVKEKSYIPEVKIETPEVIESAELLEDEVAAGTVSKPVADADQQIVQTVEQAVPTVAAADAKETAGEEGGTLAAKEELPASQRQLYNAALSGGTPDQADANWAGGLEENRVKLSRSVEKNSE